ncbi:MAG: carboxymuconolactone decarboxylase family protein [Candidatus Kapaibacterium sp.]
MGIYDEFDKRREKGNRRISGESYLPFNRFMALDTKCYEGGAVPGKFKELAGLSASAVLRCNDCILYHIRTAKDAGASRQEIIETLNIALVVGGSVVIPHLRFALEAVNELYGEVNDQDA